jgi:hypothetical protein
VDQAGGIPLLPKRQCQTACKPGSVRTPRCLGVRDDHSSWTRLAARLARPTRAAERDAPVPCGTAAPIRSCSRWGLPCRPCCQGRGALLPHRFALARGLPRGACAGGLFSVALSLGSPPPAVSRHRIPVEPGLSSTPEGPGAAVVRLSGNGRYAAARGWGQGLVQARGKFRAFRRV